MPNYHVWASLRRIIVDFVVLGLLPVCGYLCMCILQMRTGWNWSYAFSSSMPSVFWDFRTPNPATSHLSAPLPVALEPADCEDQHILSTPVLLTVSHDWYRLRTLAVALLRRPKHGVCDVPKNSPAKSRLEQWGVVSLGTCTCVWDLHLIKGLVWQRKSSQWARSWQYHLSMGNYSWTNRFHQYWASVHCGWEQWMCLVVHSNRGAHLDSLNTSCFSYNQFSFGGRHDNMCEERRWGKRKGRKRLPGANTPVPVSVGLFGFSSSSSKAILHWMWLVKSGTEPGFVLPCISFFIQETRDHSSFLSATLSCCILHLSKNKTWISFQSAGAKRHFSFLSLLQLAWGEAAYTVFTAVLGLSIGVQSYRPGSSWFQPSFAV